MSKAASDSCPSTTEPLDERALAEGAFSPQALGDPRPFLGRIFAALKGAGIDVAAFPMDHICYRVATAERYAALKSALERSARLLHEAMIGGRPIATYKLAVPLHYAGRVIDVVELPSPKPGRRYEDGYEHAEFVIAETFAAFMARHPHLSFDTSGAGKAHNPELRVVFGDISVKFHHDTLERIIAAERKASMTDLQGPAWDLSTEYPALGSPKLTADIDEAKRLIAEIDGLGQRLAPLVARAATLPAAGAEADQMVRDATAATKLYNAASVLLQDVGTFLSCELSVDGRLAEAKTLAGRVRAVSAQLEQAFNPVLQLLKLADDGLVERYLADPAMAPERFGLLEERKLRPHTLPLGEEGLMIGLAVDGPLAWGTLYDNLSGTIVCRVEQDGQTRDAGLAEAATLLQSENEATRRAAWKAINKGWGVHEESVAAILNALSGWRLETYKRRSHAQPMHFLDAPLHTARIKRGTLDAMLGAVREVRPTAQKVLRLQAQALGRDKLGPWDLFAPPPKVQPKAGAAGGTWRDPSFDEAIELIAGAYAEVDPEMGAFVRMMRDKRWIEGRVGPSKRPGAYCTSFRKSRTPRVYMTYNGGMRELKTLAHELGHALHSWVMRDMPLPETHYPMTVAETASIFGETCVNAALVSRATAPADRLAFAWAQARELEAFALNIPARFEFEKALYERRQDATLTPDDLRGLMTDAWKSWYGDALSEMDPMFWASKLHFSISDLSFYNFPYTFGFLFALGVYAQRERLGGRFYPSYVALLRDSGRMTAEDLAAKHLGADLGKPDFWRDSLAVATRSVDALEAAIAAAL
jgi:oligoendopeptidase F